MQVVYCWNRLGGVMVRLLVSGVVARWFKRRSGEIKDNKIYISCFSAKEQEQRLDGLGIMIMCPSGVKCLSMDSYLSELAILEINHDLCHMNRPFYNMIIRRV
jgi:hypothetical protein